MNGRVLVVAGSDSSGGAGLQADLKTLTALGAYGATAVTALTAQDTRGVHAVVPVDPLFVALQMRLALEDIGADCVKIGMLPDAACMEAVAAELSRVAELPLVLDPVMVAKGGSALMRDAAVAVLAARLLPRAAVLTPNLPEAARLLGREPFGADALADAALALCRLGPRAVLLKGGHLPGPFAIDVLAHAGGIHVFQEVRIDTPHTHGTGCTLASAIAAGLAQGLPLLAAVERGRAYVRRAIETAPGFGRGHGPLNHSHTVR